MFHRRIVSRSVVAALLVAAVSVAFVLPAQDAAEGQRAEATPEQAVVARLAGTWDIEVSGAMVGPEAIPGTSVVRLLGRNWAIEEVKSTMMGQPFEGVSIMGFDTEKGKFAGLWVDNFATKLDLSWSTWDEESQTLVGDAREQDGPMGKITTVGRMKCIDDDHWVFTSSPVDDEASLMLKVAYTRKQ